MARVSERMRDRVVPRARALALACLLTAAGVCHLLAGAAPAGAENRKTLLLLPVASGTPGQEWSSRALGSVLEEGFSGLPAVRLVAGTARESALRELSATAAITPEAFREICRRAGADLAVLGGSTLSVDRFSLEIRTFDVAAAQELPAFFGEEPRAQVFKLVEAAVRHVVVQAALGGPEFLFPASGTASLEAYAAYRGALLEETPAARLEKLRGALKLDPNYADPARRLGVELFQQGSLEEALVVLERAVVLGPKVAEARNNFGVALAAAAGREEQAQREFEEAVSLAPDYAEARLNLARVLEERGRLPDAEKQYTAVLEADAGNDKARAGRASLYDRTGRPELAVKEFRLLSARRPDLAEAEFITAGQEARKAREYARAEKFFLRATDINPQYSQAWSELGTNSYLAGDYPRGVEYFRRALAIEPGRGEYHYYLALALDKGRQREEALREYRRALELGGPPEARLGLARAALDSGDPGFAVEELNRLLAVNPDHAEAKTLLAQATSEMEARRRLVESQSQFANQRLARLEQIVADSNRVNRELEARILALTREKKVLEVQVLRTPGAVPGVVQAAQPAAETVGSALAIPAVPVIPTVPTVPTMPPQGNRGGDRESGDGGSARAGEQSREIERLKGELKEAVAALTQLRTEGDRVGQELAETRDRLKREAERSQAALAASESANGALARKTNEASELKGQLLAAQAAVTKAEEAQRVERERGEQSLAAERKEHAAEMEQLRVELAPALLKKQEKDRLTRELAAEKARVAAAEAAGNARAASIEKLKTELSAATVRTQELERLSRDLARAQARTAAEQSDREKAEQALSSLRAASERELVAERERGRQSTAAALEEQRRQEAPREARAAALEVQVKAQAEALQSREAELASARARETLLIAQVAKDQADLARVSERLAALEAEALKESRKIAERESAYETERLAVRDLALELGRIALRNQSWEQARGYLEQAAQADPRSGEAWYGLGEALFQLGQYEKSKRMYDKAKQIY